MRAEDGHTETVVILDRLAYRSGRRFYPVRLKKREGADGQVVYTVEMRVGRKDVIVSDAPTLEEVLRKHADLMRYAIAARGLQGRERT
jgi:hypothetical protein